MYEGNRRSIITYVIRRSEPPIRPNKMCLVVHFFNNNVHFIEQARAILECELIDYSNCK